MAARADLHHLGLFLQGKQADAPQEALQVLDIVLRELPTTRYVLFDLLSIAFSWSGLISSFHAVGTAQWDGHFIPLILVEDSHLVMVWRVGVASIKVFVQHRWAYLLTLVIAYFTFDVFPLINFIAKLHVVL